jgi:Pyruvate/2-oxoacid:ferredoxin oxidoreductase gamma subunit
MSSVLIEEKPGTGLHGDVVVNDFSLQVATANGSGSQTANSVLMRSIFQMGVPVSGKNLFPSNIAGLPTWYTIRANKHGYIARKKEIDFLVAMNPETAREDVLTLDPGGVVVYDEPLNLSGLRSDLTFYPVPFDKLVAAVCPDAKLRRLVRNMIYDGVVAYLLEIELGEMEKALSRQLGKKQKALALNLAALKAGFDYAKEHFQTKAPFRVERMNATAGKILIEGVRGAVVRPRFLQSIGRAMVLADQNINGGANRQHVNDAFARHDILLGANAMMAPTMALAGTAPKGAKLGTAAREDLRRRLGSIRGAKLSLSATDFFGVKAVNAVQTRGVQLGSVDPKLKGVVAMAHEPVIVGASGSRAAVMGAVPNVAETESEVKAFVGSLVAHRRIGYGRKAKKAAVASAIPRAYRRRVSGPRAGRARSDRRDGARSCRRAPTRAGALPVRAAGGGDLHHRVAHQPGVRVPRDRMARPAHMTARVLHRSVRRLVRPGSSRAWRARSS